MKQLQWLQLEPRLHRRRRRRRKTPKAKRAPREPPSRPEIVVTTDPPSVHENLLYSRIYVRASMRRASGGTQDRQTQRLRRPLDGPRRHKHIYLPPRQRAPKRPIPKTAQESKRASRRPQSQEGPKGQTAPQDPEGAQDTPKTGLSSVCCVYLCIFTNLFIYIYVLCLCLCLYVFIYFISFFATPQEPGARSEPARAKRAFAP